MKRVSNHEWEILKETFRFPAFNDEAGVKLPLPRRDLFQKKLMTDRNVDLTPVHEPHAQTTPENPMLKTRLCLRPASTAHDARARSDVLSRR